tara:strand:- start:30134 stop:30565 length:432 start_codon:yes stop_codon:yes gene_type:complete
MNGICEALPPGAISVEVHKEGKAGQADRGHIRIESQSEPPSMQEGFRDFWVFVDAETLQRSSKDLYAFQLLHFECLDRATGSREAKITGYQETGAHGILEVELPEGREILVPLVPPHATVDLEKGIIEFNDLHSLDPDSGDRN